MFSKPYFSFKTIFIIVIIFGTIYIVPTKQKLYNVTFYRIVQIQMKKTNIKLMQTELYNDS